MKWHDLVEGGDGFLYGIPYNANRIVRFHPLDKSLNEIGPDLGDGECKYWSGILANGSIYCAPYRGGKILKITPVKGGDVQVDFLDQNLPGCGHGVWLVGALAKDGCIYYMPYHNTRHILKLDTNDHDRISLVGEDLGRKKCLGAILGNDSCIYVVYEINWNSKKVIRFDPSVESISYIGEDLNEYDNFRGGVLAADGNIYTANRHGQVLKIDTAKNVCTMIGSKIFTKNNYCGWGPPVLGRNNCIYFPPHEHDRILKFNPKTQNISLVGSSLGNTHSKWYGAALASDGFIYCIPLLAKQVLQINES